MRIVMLGTGTAVKRRYERRGDAGIYVSAAGEHLVLDAGPGTMTRLAQVGVTYLDLTRVFLTHYHPDHCLDLVSILFAMRLPDPARRKPVWVYGPRGLRLLYRRLNTAFSGWIEPRSYRLTLSELESSTLHLGRLTVRTLPMRHSAPAVGYRIESPTGVLAYSGDTDVCREIVELGRGADVLILECSVTDERKVRGHLTPTECGRIAAEAGCRRLVLTHFYPVFEGYNIAARVRRAYRGPLTLAADFRELRVLRRRARRLYRSPATQARR